MSGHADAVPLTAETYAEVMPPDQFAEVTFQRCTDAGCGWPTMIVYGAGIHGSGRNFVFHLADAELSAIESGAGRFLAGLAD